MHAAVESQHLDQAVRAAMERFPTILDSLVYLARRSDIRRTTAQERSEGREHRTYVAGEPIAAALLWVHSRGDWRSKRNGGELWDLVGQVSRGDTVDPEIRSVVLPHLHMLDQNGHLRGLWTEIMHRFPHIAQDILADPHMPPMGWQCLQNELLRFLLGQPDHRIEVASLPSQFLNPELLTVMDADRLIEFGHRKHCRAGSDLRVERGWDFVSITGPDKKPMPMYLDEVRESTVDPRIREHVQLTAKGRVEASRVALATMEHPKTAPPVAAGMKWEDAMECAERHVKRNNGVFPGRNTLADDIVGCSRPTMTKAILRSPYLKARQAEAEARAQKPIRATTLPKAALESVPGPERDGGELSRLVAEQKAEDARDNRQAKARQMKRSR